MEIKQQKTIYSKKKNRMKVKKKGNGGERIEYRQKMFGFES